jgi:hypothetical protein
VSKSLEYKSLSDGNALILEALDSGSLFTVGRLGSVEFNLIKKLDAGKSLTLLDRKMGWVNAGIWPPSRSEFLRFRDRYVAAIRNSEYMAVWPEKLLTGQASFLQEHAPNAKKLALGSLDPVLLAASGLSHTVWSKSLRGKKVLIVHSMASSVEEQRHKLTKLHPDGAIPQFDSKVIVPPSTNGLVFWKRGFEQQLEEFQINLKAMVIEFKPDVALVAAGAYGMPIQQQLRQMGVSSIYVGGALQLVFGILGHRWRSRPEIMSRANHYWLTAPLEKPPFGFRLVERGTYW